VNTTLNFVVCPNFRFNVGDRYIHNNPFFVNSNFITFGSYLRLNDNWGVSVQEQYEMQDHILEYQSYQVHRDLSSWTASLGFQVRNNKVNGQGSLDYGVLLTFTLKDFPQISSPISFAPGQLGGSSQNK
jgi:LPS-assembly protein